MYICVLCSTRKAAEPINYEYGNPNIRERILDCVPELNRDMLGGGGICNECFHQLIVSYNFRIRCMQAKHNWENNILDTKSEDELLTVMNATDLTKNVTNVLYPRKQLEFSGIKEENGELTTMEAKPKTHSPKDSNENDIFRINYGTGGNSSGGGNIQKRVFPFVKKGGTDIRKVIKSTVVKNIMKNNQKPLKLSNEACRLLQSFSSEEVTVFKQLLSKPCRPVSCESCNIRLNCIHEKKYHEGLYHMGLTMKSFDFNVLCEICSSNINHRCINRHLESHGLKVEDTEEEFVVVD